MLERLKEGYESDVVEDEEESGDEKKDEEKSDGECGLLAGGGDGGGSRLCLCGAGCLENKVTFMFGV